jgi:hypothetical protein
LAGGNEDVSEENTVWNASMFNGFFKFNPNTAKARSLHEKQLVGWIAVSSGAI